VRGVSVGGAITETARITESRPQILQETSYHRTQEASTRKNGEWGDQRTEKCHMTHIAGKKGSRLEERKTR